MGIRTVRLDDDTERLLSQITQTTGISISTAFKKGLRALQSELGKEKSRRSYAVYKELDLGPGGYAIASSSDTKKVVKDAIKRKLGR
ncbi:MAG: hypothetical protein JRJ38_19415 [Deltaproteobacteria bacterium]|nr:hypothetical protein [Deltaproteobacteria bacterium]